MSETVKKGATSEIRLTTEEEVDAAKLFLVGMGPTYLSMIVRGVTEVLISAEEEDPLILRDPESGLAFIYVFDSDEAYMNARKELRVNWDVLRVPIRDAVTGLLQMALGNNVDGANVYMWDADSATGHLERVPFNKKTLLHTKALQRQAIKTREKKKIVTTLH